MRRALIVAALFSLVSFAGRAQGGSTGVRAAPLEVAVGGGRLALVDASRSLTARNPREPAGSPSSHLEIDSTLSLRFRLEGPRGWAESVAQAGPCIAEDDRGNLLRLTPGRFPVELGPGNYLFLVYSARGISPRARRLRWVQGWLGFQRPGREVRLEFPLQASATGRPQQALEPVEAGGLEIILTPRRVGEGELFLYWRVRHLDDSPIRPAEFGLLHTRLIGTDGRPIAVTAPVRSAGSSMASWKYWLTVSEHYRVLPEAPAAVVLEGRLYASDIVREPFRIDDWPLPGEDLGRRESPAPRRAHASIPVGTLTTQVLRAGKGAGAGVISWALVAPPGRGSPSLPDEWVPWVNTRTDRRGSARLERVAPGEYEVRRQWWPRTPRGVPARMIETPPVRVRVEAGAKLDLPPMEAGTGSPPRAR